MRVQRSINGLTPVSLYKSLLLQYYPSGIGRWRLSFNKILKEFASMEIFWKEYIMTGFEVYDKIKRKFGHIPQVARSPHYPEPHIFLIDDILNEIKGEFFSSYDFSIPRELVRRYQLLDLISEKEAMERIERMVRDGVSPANAIIAVNMACIEKDDMGLWYNIKDIFKERLSLFLEGGK
ncbi:MAG: hypothetical protein QW561_04615 [Candidatus Aenigmatarchaeota archaeon]